MRYSLRRLVGAGLAAGVLAAIVSFPSLPAQAQGSLPYTDPAADAVIGLCNHAGQSISQGSILDVPFAWTAVSSGPAPPPYNGPGGTATLYAYQPRQGVAPGDWSGDLLTASSRYTNPVHPMAQATDGDESLQQFLAEYPTVWDGLVELRLYLGAPDQPVYSLKYAATDIKVTGDQWVVVHGGDVACNSGRATSIEQLLLPPRLLTPTTARPATDPRRAGSSPRPGGGGGSVPQGRGAVAAGATMHFTVSEGGPHWALWTVAAGAVAAAFMAFGGWAWFRRRRSPRTPPLGG